VLRSKLRVSGFRR